MAAKAVERCKSPEEAQLLSPKPKENTEQLTIEVRYEGPRICTSNRLKPKTAEAPEVLDETHNHLNGDQLGSVTTERQLVKNIVILGIAFACVFSSFSALQSLQSSLFQQSALGLKALCCVYGLTVISTLYAPIFVHKVTPNWAITLSFVMVALFTSTFFYPRFYTLVPSAVLVGLTFGPLFSAQTSFLMHLVSKITCLTEEIREKVQQRFLRLFYLLYNLSRIIGNLLTALVLRYSGDVYVYMTKKLHHYDHTPSMTVSYQLHDTQMSVSLSRDVTGPSFCRNVECQTGEVLRSTPNFIFLLPSNTSFVLVSIYLGLVLTGVALVATMLDKFEVYVYQDPLERSLWSRALRKMAVLLFDPNQPLLLPLVFFIGMEQGFIYATFTQVFIDNIGVDIH
ncbi:UNC93-like protein [Limulus polyphemus]|uniref:UNC93-like protein n=1 Tax=Limulus polyphemus TaxID=6850 RepID=A0ABM1BLY7_LIMPO|nr:UNC93-like protein [Limulus polyphemus]